MNKKLVIFDLDGTLLDTSFDLMNSMNGMLESFFSIFFLLCTCIFYTILMIIAPKEEKSKRFLLKY